MITIRQEILEDIRAIRYVNTQAFEQEEEAALIERLRSNNAITLSLVAVEGDQIVGHILFSPVTMESEQENFNAIALAPMSVLPPHQRKGIGSQLVRAALQECHQLGHEIIFVLGHAEYYPKFGFVQAKLKGIGYEFEAPSEAWMVLELREGALAERNGTVIFRPEFKETM